MSDTEIEMTTEQVDNLSDCCGAELLVEFPVPRTRGRKPKYLSDEERKLAKREQNKRYRMKKHEELIALRRAVNKMNDSETKDSETIES